MSKVTIGRCENILYDFRTKGTSWNITVASLHELAKSNPSQGMYWNHGNGLKWNEMPIEAHASIMELMHENIQWSGQTGGNEDMAVVSKKTHHWPSTEGNSRCNSYVAAL